MNININGKGLLATALLSSSIVFANFVSFIDTGSAGGISIEKETMTVGAVVLRVDNVNPSTIYGGSWELLQGDAAIRLGDGKIVNTTVKGNNNPIVPVPHHTHAASFVGNALPPHSHSQAFSDDYKGVANIVRGAGNNGSFSTGSVSAGTPSGTVSVSATGTSNATLDVRGAFITINVWKRIS